MYITVAAYITGHATCVISECKSCVSSAFSGLEYPVAHVPSIQTSAVL